MMLRMPKKTVLTHELKIELDDLFSVTLHGNGETLAMNISPDKKSVVFELNTTKMSVEDADVLFAMFDSRVHHVEFKSPAEHFEFCKCPVILTSVKEKDDGVLIKMIFTFEQFKETEII